MSYYHCQPQNRIGDEIQTTALASYMLSKGRQLYYKDVNFYVSAMELFPDNLVVFTSNNFDEAPVLDPFNLWFWNPFLRSKGIYTSLKDVYQENKADIDLVFVPVLQTYYNTERQIDPKSAYETFINLRKRHPKMIMIIDANKRQVLNLDEPNVIYSNDIYKTFNLIKRSKIYVGTDTGVTHYAGAIKHPRMILAHPDETPLHEEFKWHREVIATQFDEPEILNVIMDSLPCCDHKNIHVSYIKNHTIPIENIINDINKL